MIAFRIIIRCNIFSEHKAVFDISIADAAFMDRTIVSLHLDISSIGHIVFVCI